MYTEYCCLDPVALLMSLYRLYKVVPMNYCIKLYKNKVVLLISDLLPLFIMPGKAYVFLSLLLW